MKRKLFQGLIDQVAGPSSCNNAETLRGTSQSRSKQHVARTHFTTHSTPVFSAAIRRHIAVTMASSATDALNAILQKLENDPGKLKQVLKLLGADDEKEDGYDAAENEDKENEGMSPSV